MSVPGLDKRSPGFNPDVGLGGRIPFASDEDHTKLRVLLRMRQASGELLNERGECIAKIQQTAEKDSAYEFSITMVPERLMLVDRVTHVTLEGVFIPVDPHTTLIPRAGDTLYINTSVFDADHRF